MLVSRFDQLAGGVVPCRYDMHIQVQRRHPGAFLGKPQSLQPRFLRGLAKGGRWDVKLAIGMPAGLEPAIELAMVNQQDSVPLASGDPGGRRDMARAASAIEAIGMAGDERADS